MLPILPPKATDKNNVNLFVIGISLNMVNEKRKKLNIPVIKENVKGGNLST